MCYNLESSLSRCNLFLDLMISSKNCFGGRLQRANRRLAVRRVVFLKTEKNVETPINQFSPDLAFGCFMIKSGISQNIWYSS